MLSALPDREFWKEVLIAVVTLPLYIAALGVIGFAVRVFLF